MIETLSISKNLIAWTLRLSLAVFCLLGAFIGGSSAAAQERALEVPAQTQSSTDYTRSIRLRGIDHEVIYFDPEAPAPPLSTDYSTPEPQEGDDLGEVIGQTRTAFNFLGWIAAGILAVIIYVFIRSGGAMSLSLQKTAENTSTATRIRESAEVIGDDPLAGFDAILAMPDRRDAIVALTRRALSDCLAAQGVLPQRSWTARDALRRLRLPPESLSLLRALVLDSERVQYGDRPMTDAIFESHVSAIRPIMTGGAV